MQNKGNEVRVTAKNLDLALSEAATRLQVDQNQIDYRVVSQGSGGIFSFLAKKIEIAAWKKALDLDELMTDDGAETEYEVEALSPEEVEALKRDLQMFCQEICSDS
jgi:predicted RNA-binding protein Jag